MTTTAMALTHLGTETPCTINERPKTIQVAEGNQKEQHARNHLVSHLDRHAAHRVDGARNDGIHHAVEMARILAIATMQVRTISSKRESAWMQPPIKLV